MTTKRYFLTLILLCFICVSALFAQYDFMHDGYYEGKSTIYAYPNKHYSFSAPDKIRYWQYQPDIEISGAYNINDNNGVLFLHINWNDNTQEKYLMLVNQDLLILYNDDANPVFLGSRVYEYGDGDGYRLTVRNMHYLSTARASSWINENGINYEATPERLGLIINQAWAVRGGINETLTINPYSPYYNLHISIGYVSFRNPNLYRENSRPKKIRISDVHDPTRFIEYEFEDTPNFQEISTRIMVQREDSPYYYYQRLGAELLIEILEIYPGTKYNDTCITSIITFGSY